MIFYLLFSQQLAKFYVSPKSLVNLENWVVDAILLSG